MNGQDPLSQLHPLRVPEPVSWWPPAPGWWIVATLLFALLGYTGLRLWRRHRRNAYRRRALAALSELRRGSAAQHRPEFAVQINAVLKHCAMEGFGKAQVASINGRAWRDFLSGTLPPGTTAAFEFAEEIYCEAGPAQSVSDITADADTWIRRHRVRK